MRCSECGVGEVSVGGEEEGRYNLCLICYDDYCNGRRSIYGEGAEEEDAYCEWLEEEADRDYSFTS